MRVELASTGAFYAVRGLGQKLSHRIQSKVEKVYTASVQDILFTKARIWMKGIIYQHRQQLIAIDLAYRLYRSDRKVYNRIRVRPPAER